MSAPEEVIPRAAENGAGPHRSSHLAQLAQVRDAELATRTTTYRLRLWDGPSGWGLEVRLRALPYAQVMPITRRAMAPLVGTSDDPEAELKAACDCLVAACEDVYALDPEGKHVALDDSSEEPCRFDARTCELLGLREPKSARDATRLVFRSDFHVIDCWGDYQAFVTQSKGEVTDDVLGEA